MKNKNGLIKINKLNKKEILKQLSMEINNEYEIKLKNIIKEKIKNIKKMEIILEKQRQELNDLLDGKQVKTEEEMLFND